MDEGVPAGGLREEEEEEDGRERAGRRATPGHFERHALIQVGFKGRRKNSHFFFSPSFVYGQSGEKRGREIYASFEGCYLLEIPQRDKHFPLHAQKWTSPPTPWQKRPSLKCREPQMEAIILHRKKEAHCLREVMARLAYLRTAKKAPFIMPLSLY